MRSGRALLGLVLVAAGARAQGYQRTEVPGTAPGTLCLTWANRHLVYRVDAAGSARTPQDTELTAIERAFATWQTLSLACSDFTFEPGLPVSAPRVGPGSSEAHVLTFREVSCNRVVPPGDPCLADQACGDAHRCWGYDPAVIALTTLTYDARTGVVLDADVELDAAGFLFTTVDAPVCPAAAPEPSCVATDLQNTVTHEIGHVVGLAHVSLPGSTMAAGAVPGETSKRTIDPGTAAGFCHIYPAGQPPTPCDPAAAGSGQVQAAGAGCGCGQGPLGGGAALAAMLLAAMRRRHPGDPFA